MKTLILITLNILFLVVAASAQTAPAEGIVWENDFKKAQQLARETGRPLLLDFTASWCKPCQMMEKDFWVRAEVIEALKPFIAVKINFDTDKKSVGRYNVSAIPFVLFTDPLGNAVTFRRGFSAKNTSELNQIFTEIPKDFKPMLGFYEALDRNEKDGAALLALADAYSTLR